MRARISTQWTGRDDLAEPSFVPNFAPRSLFRQKPVFGVTKVWGGLVKMGERFYLPWKNRDWLSKGTSRVQNATLC